MAVGFMVSAVVALASVATMVSMSMPWMSGASSSPQSSGNDLLRKAACPEGKRVILWTGPRSGSSLFARAMMQRADSVVLFERLFDAHYLGPQNQSGNYFFEPEGMDVQTRTYDALYDEFLAPLPQGREFMFAKEMAYYMVHPKVDQASQQTEMRFVDSEWPPIMDCFQHTFLIRRPQHQVASMVKVTIAEAKRAQELVTDSVTKDQQLPMPADFDMDEVGVKQLHFLFDAVRQRAGGLAPVTVDFDRLVREPDRIMHEYCNKIGVAFDTAMLTWAKGWREEFRYWNEDTEWMKDVLTSHGFNRDGGSTTRKQLKNNTAVEGEQQDIVAEAVRIAQPLYDEMIKAAIV